MKFGASVLSVSVIDAHPDNPVLLMIHDWGYSARVWEPMRSHLRAFRMLSYDQRGWGRSNKISAEPTLTDLVEDLRELVRRVGKKGFVVVTHGISSRVALRYASATPAGLLGLVMIAPAPALCEPSHSRERSTLLQHSKNAEWVQMSKTGYSGHAFDSQLEADARNGSAAAKKAWESLEKEDLQPLAAAITVPILVIAAELDAVYPISQQIGLSDLIPTGKCQLMSDAGHLLPLSHPQKVAASIAGFASRHARISLDPRRAIN